jgi:hypothetical protein
LLLPLTLLALLALPVSLAQLAHTQFGLVLKTELLPEAVGFLSGQAGSDSEDEDDELDEESGDEDEEIDLEAEEEKGKKRRRL